MFGAVFGRGPSVGFGYFIPGQPPLLEVGRCLDLAWMLGLGLILYSLPVWLGSCLALLVSALVGCGIEGDGNDWL